MNKDASIVVLTGAGISAESGLETFRGGSGLWCGHKIEDVATPEAFVRDAHLVHDFYNMRRRNLLAPNIKPNAAHLALAKLEEEWPGEVLVVTQNVDDLHERAGTKNLIHMHGEVLRAFCVHCGRRTPWQHDLSTNHDCLNCRKIGGLRPDIVWFGETPYHIERILTALRKCDLFLSIGTSGNVYPAAGFVQQALLAGAHTVEANLEPAQNSSMFHKSLIGAATQIVPAYIDKLLG